MTATRCTNRTELNSPGMAHTTVTELQSHAGFFDRDGDGIIYPQETYLSLRDIGFGVILAFIAAFIIHFNLSWFTWGTILPDPMFRLKIKNMHKAKHGSDSEVYTTLGEFDDKRFNYIFDMYSVPPHTHLSFPEGFRMVYGNRNPFDVFGWFAAGFEWLATYILLWPGDGRVTKKDIRAIYDGSLFYELAEKKKKAS